MSKPYWLLHTFYSFGNSEMAQGGIRFSVCRFLGIPLLGWKKELALESRSQLNS